MRGEALWADLGRQSHRHFRTRGFGANGQSDFGEGRRDPNDRASVTVRVIGGHEVSIQKPCGGEYSVRHFHVRGVVTVLIDADPGHRRGEISVKEVVWIPK